MGQPVIQVRDLGKRYRIRSLDRSPCSNLREDLVNGIKQSGVILPSPVGRERVMVRYSSISLNSDNIAAILARVKEEPAIITDESQDVAIILSMTEYQKILKNNIESFQDFCDRVGLEAENKGLTEALLFEILKDE